MLNYRDRDFFVSLDNNEYLCKISFCKRIFKNYFLKWKFMWICHEIII